MACLVALAGRTARLVTLAAAAVAALALCAGCALARSGGAVGGAGPACGPAAARTLAAGPLARVYADARTVFGCARGSAPRRLGIMGPCRGPGTIRAAAVSGRDAAVATLVCGVDTGGATVTVIRLTDGRLLSSHPAAPVTAPESFTSVEGLVLAPDATAAWIGRVDSIVRAASVTRVYAASPSGRAPARTLDPGPGVVAGSLRLSGSTASWRHGAQRRHARL